MHTTKLHIGQEVLEVFPENLQTLYLSLQEEFGWGDLVFTDVLGTVVTPDYPLEGATLRVREVVHRQKCATIQFPGFPEWVTIYKDTGLEIKRWIKEQVGCRCKVRVISRSWVPCFEKVDKYEICDDAQFGITLIDPLPIVKPVNHSGTRQPNFRQKREAVAWLALLERRRELETRYFKEAQGESWETSKRYWKEMKDDCEQIQKR
jgi:hypothetical protein